MPTPTKRMAFWNVGKGTLAQKMQDAFEDAQKLSLKHNQKIVVTCKINVFPPENADEPFGGISFTVDTSKPAYKSMEFMTELDEKGRILQDGDDYAELLQEELDLRTPNEVEVNFKKTEVK
jgi:hypothetical protein